MTAPREAMAAALESVYSEWVEPDDLPDIAWDLHAEDTLAALAASGWVLRREGEGLTVERVAAALDALPYSDKATVAFRASWDDARAFAGWLVAALDGGTAVSEVERLVPDRGGLLVQWLVDGRVWARTTDRDGQTVASVRGDTIAEAIAALDSEPRDAR